MSGKLYVVPTPIGNLEDITFRALRVLKEVDLVLAEDTRTAGQLLRHFDIDKRILSHHQHNEHHALKEVIRLLKEGKTMALVSDAGTPAISDPGFLLVRECVKENIDFETLPGATAFVPALVNSGLPSDKFYFEGFLPQKKGRKTRLEFLTNIEDTIILYESPHRLLKLLEEVILHFGAEHYMSVSREISKKFEETLRGSATELLLHFTENPIKGEFVVCLSGVKKIHKKENKYEQDDDES
ncbi:MAG: 16S rRNA (cytidine(1402)-2'-O)-methyltransferase [Sphingobacteriales bacterium]|nr:16S rRNA (cytidine(1402)-2'-O)-methyltransferase [Sphingobacteriales bacterium]